MSTSRLNFNTNATTGVIAEGFSGDVTIAADSTGTVTLGSANSTQQIHNAKISNIISDSTQFYEEGTTVPTIINGIGQGATSYSVQDCSFVRNGKAIYFNLRILISAKNAGWVSPNEELYFRHNIIDPVLNPRALSHQSYKCTNVTGSLFPNNTDILHIRRVTTTTPNFELRAESEASDTRVWVTGDHITDNFGFECQGVIILA